MASVPEPGAFREFCPLYYLLNAIPTKIQKGFRSVLVYLTALDTSGDYIAVGSSIGMIYLYCRHFNQMKKYSFEVSPTFLYTVRLTCREFRHAVTYCLFAGTWPASHPDSTSQVYVVGVEYS